MKKEAWLGFSLLLPALLVLSIFVFFPALQSFYFSFLEIEPFSQEQFFVGFENYSTLLFSPEYWRSIRISLLFTLYTAVPSVLISLFLAVWLDAQPYFQSFFRTVFLLPVSISSSMAAMLWIFIFNPTAGYLNYLLDVVGIVGPSWLADPDWALPAVAVTTLWKELGFNVIFFLAGLTSVPMDLKEAAHLDGANGWQRFYHVTLPILSPTVFFVSVVSVIHAMESFGQIHILTLGGPMGETSTLVYNLYRDAFVNFRTGLASAEAVILFVILMAGTIIQFRIAKRRVHYG